MRYFFLFILINSILVTSLSLSPAIQKSSLEINEESCFTFYINSNVDYDKLIISDQWTDLEINKNILSSYNSTSDDFLINIAYPALIEPFDQNNISINVCLNGEKEGNYFGAIIFTALNDGAGLAPAVGAWLRINITKPIEEVIQEPEEQIEQQVDETVEENSNEITGHSTDDIVMDLRNSYLDKKKDETVVLEIKNDFEEETIEEIKENNSPGIGLGLGVLIILIITLLVAWRLR